MIILAALLIKWMHFPLRADHAGLSTKGILAFLRFPIHISLQINCCINIRLSTDTSAFKACNLATPMTWVKKLLIQLAINAIAQDYLKMGHLIF